MHSHPPGCYPDVESACDPEKQARCCWCHDTAERRMRVSRSEHNINIIIIIINGDVVLVPHSAAGKRNDRRGEARLEMPGCERVCERCDKMLFEINNLRVTPPPWWYSVDVEVPIRGMD